MTQNRIVLTDVAEGIYVESFQITQDDGPRLPGTGKWSITKRRLRGGVSDGVDVVDLDNGLLSVSVLPTRGMGVWRARCGEHRIGWDSPVAHPVHPNMVNLRERDGLGWLRGFNELICRCGLGWNGPPGVDAITDATGAVTEHELTLHGRIANTPAHEVIVTASEENGGSLAVVGVVDEACVFGPALQLKSIVLLRPGQTSFEVVDEITNLGATPAEVQLLYHTNIGRPFLEAGSQFVAPVRELAPRDHRAAEGTSHYETYGPPQVDYAEQAYYMRLLADADGRTLALLKNAGGDLGLSVGFDHNQLPCFTLWKNTQAEADGYVTGLEPATNFPNLKTYERQQGRVIVLEPGASFRAGLTVSVHIGADEIASAEHEIAELQQQHSPQVHPVPREPFSAG